MNRQNVKNAKKTIPSLGAARQRTGRVAAFVRVGIPFHPDAPAAGIEQEMIVQWLSDAGSG